MSESLFSGQGGGESGGCDPSDLGWERGGGLATDTLIIDLSSTARPARTLDRVTRVHRVQNQVPREPGQLHTLAEHRQRRQIM